MARAEIFAGICGFKTIVETSMDGRYCNVNIKSDCKSIQSLAEELKRVEPYQEISFRRSMPLTYLMASKHCAHAACPVASEIVKNPAHRAGLLPRKSLVELGAHAPKPLFAIHPRAQRGVFWLFHIKAIEVEARLALPADVTIKVSK